ncbi:MAG: hypothetical protein WD960_13460 [Gemmatimonadota bacterium]
MASTRSGIRWKWSVVRFSREPIRSTIPAYSAVVWSVSASGRPVSSWPSIFRIALRVARSSDERKREKFRNLQLQTSGGQAARMCAGAAPVTMDSLRELMERVR